MNFHQHGNDGRIQFNQWSAKDGKPDPLMWPRPIQPPIRPMPPIQPPIRPMPPTQPPMRPMQPIQPPMPPVATMAPVMENSILMQRPGKDIGLNWRGGDAGRQNEIDWGSLGDGHGEIEQNGELRSGRQVWSGNGAGWNGKVGGNIVTL